ncbi:MAG: hypothetical protein HDR88_02690 [Bacteroides sp.]|nr:hypothetical protein [Bacteroides sp.]
MKSRIIILTLMLGILSVVSVQGGRRIVPETLLSDRQFGMAANFLQHYFNLLSQPLTEENEDIIRRIKDDGFTYSKGNDIKMRDLTEDADFFIDFDNGAYSACWEKEGSPIVVCEFPAKIGLMRLENKKELENHIIEMFRTASANPTSTSRPTTSIESVTAMPFSDFYVKDIGSFITPDLTHKIVYLPSEVNNRECELVCDPGKYPLESLSNMLLTGYSEKNVPIDLTIRQYGYNSTPIVTSLAKLYDIFSEEGCIPYWGVKEHAGDKVKGIYVWKNDMGGYCHLVSLEVPLSALSTEGKLKATLHSYLRLDNLKSLFADFSEQ